ncbi:hypothetical protein SBDP1_1680025 [Syntrophobacter sp. SbD1]|nr:hypothetical protein SBDP1_1680025 [Syntrophobacter sp. SbD1]
MATLSQPGEVILQKYSVKMSTPHSVRGLRVAAHGAGSTSIFLPPPPVFRPPYSI